MLENYYCRRLNWVLEMCSLVTTLSLLLRMLMYSPCNHNSCTRTHINIPHTIRGRNLSIHTKLSYAQTAHINVYLYFSPNAMASTYSFRFVLCRFCQYVSGVNSIWSRFVNEVYTLNAVLPTFLLLFPCYVLRHYGGFNAIILLQYAYNMKPFVFGERKKLSKCINKISISMCFFVAVVVVIIGLSFSMHRVWALWVQWFGVLTFHFDKLNISTLTTSRTHMHQTSTVVLSIITII